MLSLANAFDKNDLDNFEKKITNYLNQKDYSGVSQVQPMQNY